PLVDHAVDSDRTDRDLRARERDADLDVIDHDARLEGDRSAFGDEVLSLEGRDQTEAIGSERLEGGAVELVDEERTLREEDAADLRRLHLSVEIMLDVDAQEIVEPAPERLPGE